MKTYNQLKVEIKNWADYNFDNHAPHLGVVEELGELAQAYLKKHQKIRKYEENDATFVDDVIDSLADCAIFALHWAAIHDLDIPEIIQVHRAQDNIPILHAYALQHAAYILITEQTGGVGGGPLVTQLLTNLSAICSHYDVKLSSIVNSTWAEVSKRDWRKYPKTGLPPVPVSEG